MFLYIFFLLCPLRSSIVESADVDESCLLQRAQLPCLGCKIQVIHTIVHNIACCATATTNKDYSFSLVLHFHFKFVE